MRRIWTITVPMQIAHPAGPAYVPYANLPADVHVPSRAVAAPAAQLPAPAAVARAVVPPPVTSGHRYVQVASFGVPENARNTVQRFQGMGLPVRTTQVRSSGRTLEVVLIGPFATAGDLSAALDAARRAGFRDAYIRG